MQQIRLKLQNVGVVFLHLINTLDAFPSWIENQNELGLASEVCWNPERFTSKEIIDYPKSKGFKTRKGNGLIKVITGIRRCGKSYLLFNLFYNYLKETGVQEDCILKIALDDDLNERLRDPSELSSYIRAAVKDTSKTYYILLDEVQFGITEEEYLNPQQPVKIFSALNGLLRLPNVDIYVTDSNSRFLSKDVLTELQSNCQFYLISFTPVSLTLLQLPIHGNK